MFAGSPPFEATIGVTVRASEFRLFVKAAAENEFYDEVEAFPEAGTRFLGSLCMTSALEPPSRGTPPGRQIHWWCAQRTNPIDAQRVQ